MKKGVLLFIFWVFLFVPANNVSAQELEFDPCDPQQVEVVDEELCFFEEEQPIDENPVPEDESEAEPVDKGQPSPETVAGNEQPAAQTGVLGASTTTPPQVLAATGVEAWVFVLAGAIIITETIVLFSVLKKE